LIEYSQLILLNHRNPSFGREISPYVLWACLNNQFANATLKNIYHLGSKQNMEINTKNAKDVFKNIYKTKQTELSSNSFRWSVNNLNEILNTTGEGNNSIPIKYSIDKKQLTSALLINRYPSYVKSSIAELFQFKFGFKFPVTLHDYIRLCINDISLKSQLQTIDLLQGQYLLLHTLNDEFSKWITPLLTKDKKSYNFKVDLSESLDIDFAEKVKVCLLSIQSKDFIFSSKAISFMQGLAKSHDKDLKDKVFTFLLKLTYEPNPLRKMIKGEKQKLVTLLKPQNLDGVSVL